MKEEKFFLEYLALLLKFRSPVIAVSRTMVSVSSGVGLGQIISELGVVFKFQQYIFQNSPFLQVGHSTDSNWLFGKHLTYIL